MPSIVCIKEILLVDFRLDGPLENELLMRYASRDQLHGESLIDRNVVGAD